VTIAVLRTSARLNLRSIRDHVLDAHQDGLISDQDCAAILQAQGLLSTLIADSCERGLERDGTPSGTRTPVAAGQSTPGEARPVPLKAVPGGRPA
jgi:hypothetical protein